MGEGNYFGEMQDGCLVQKIPGNIPGIFTLLGYIFEPHSNIDDGRYIEGLAHRGETIWKRAEAEDEKRKLKMIFL